MFERSKLMPTNLPDVFAFPPMPGDVDPNTALTITLIKHGLLWRRPTPEDHPRCTLHQIRPLPLSLPGIMSFPTSHPCLNESTGPRLLPSLSMACALRRLPGVALAGGTRGRTGRE